MTTSTTPRPVRRRLAVATVLVLTTAACGGGGGPAAQPAAVEISGNAYDPADLEISSGQSVTWTNRDAVPHTVTFSGGDVTSSDQLAEGDSFTATFDDSGTYAYVCAVHPEMTGTVTVTG